MIDWERTSELQGEIGSEGFVEVVTMFLEEMEEEMNALRSAPPAQDLEGKLHFLKGSALNLGFESFASLCESGEKAAAQGRHDEINLGDLVVAYEASKARFLANMPQELSVRHQSASQR